MTDIKGGRKILWSDFDHTSDDGVQQPIDLLRWVSKKLDSTKIKKQNDVKKSSWSFDNTINYWEGEIIFNFIKICEDIDLNS
jgi:hypothetical protein